MASVAVAVAIRDPAEDTCQQWVDEVDAIGPSTRPELLAELSALYERAPQGVDPEFVAMLRDHIQRHTKEASA